MAWRFCVAVFLAAVCLASSGRTDVTCVSCAGAVARAAPTEQVEICPEAPGQHFAHGIRSQVALSSMIRWEK
jgi:hypothetical protein